ncbi:MAG: hypothetical protein GWN47_11655 [Woeseiaceae bacterium]|nr:hypothetical protein [Woeseiaceae bacterium]
MRPLTAITGILLGSCVAITVSLAAVLFVYLVLGTDQPRIEHEFRPLLKSMLIFLGMTSISGLSFYALLIGHRIRYWVLAIMLTALAATIWYYMP